MKGLDWTNETWVRLYRTDSPSWKRLKWEAQSVYLGLQRKLNRAGCLSLDGLLDFEAVAEMIGCPEDVAERALPRLYQLGFLVKSGDGDLIVDPEFMERDEAASSDAQRKRDSRERQRDRGMSRNVTPESRKVTEPSHSVTAGHTRSLRDEPSLEETIQEEDPPLPPEVGDPPPPRQRKLPRKTTAADVTRELVIPAELLAAGIDAEAVAKRVRRCKILKYIDTWQDELDRLAPLIGELGEDLVSEVWADATNGQWQGCTPAQCRDRARSASRKPVQGNGRRGRGPDMANGADFDWDAYVTERRIEDERLDPFRKALADAEETFGEESEEYTAALLALMEAQA